MVLWMGQLSWIMIICADWLHILLGHIRIILWYILHNDVIWHFFIPLVNESKFGNNRSQNTHLFVWYWLIYDRNNWIKTTSFFLLLPIKTEAWSINTNYALIFFVISRIIFDHKYRKCIAGNVFLSRGEKDGTLVLNKFWINNLLTVFSEILSFWHGQNKFI